jgi:hypothetical protein
MIEQLVRLLNVLASWFERHRRNSREQQAQAERHDVEKNPNAWFDRHFGGMPPDDARQANKTDVDKKQ